MQPFEPLVLSDETVQAIYDHCLANEGTPDEDKAQSMAFLGVCGYARDVFQKVFFNRARIAEDRKNLYYLYGQLSGVHEPEDLPYAPHPTLSIGGCMRNYRGETWFRDRKSLLMLLTELLNVAMIFAMFFFFVPLITLILMGISLLFPC